MSRAAPQTQHKRVVYGDDELMIDENTPKPNRQPELDPPVRRRPQHTQTGGPRAATPQGLTVLRTPDRRNGVRDLSNHPDFFENHRVSPRGDKNDYVPGEGLTRF